tara:strand:+ start:68 stop:298 length:231 start_codon:yes stop_codon:yes gene_type:complete
MFGLEDSNSNRKVFMFDLEKDIKSDFKKKQECLKIIRNKHAKIKSTLREGTEEANFDNFGILLQGYRSLEKIINEL